MKPVRCIEELKETEHGIIIWLQTGTAWLQGIFFEDETKRSDLLGLLDEAYSEMKDDFPVALYDLSEIDEDERENFIPLNGGEKYIEGVAYVDEF